MTKTTDVAIMDGSLDIHAHSVWVSCPIHPTWGQSVVTLGQACHLMFRHLKEMHDSLEAEGEYTDG